MKLATIINSFNRKELLIKAMQSLVSALAADPLDYAIVVFDAGSTDGSLEWLRAFRAENPSVRMDVVESRPGEDTSFAAGVNRACDRALELFPELEFLFLYETDNWIGNAKPIHQAIQILRQQQDLVAMGFTVRLHSGVAGGWGQAFPTVTSFVLGREISKRLSLPRCVTQTHTDDGISWFTADVVYTSPLVIKAAAWVALEGIDARLFPFADSDLDWAWRAARKGYKLGVLKTDAVVHDGLAQSSSWSSMRVVSFHTARYKLLRKYRGIGVALSKPALFLRHVAEFGLLLAMVIIRKRPAFSLRKRSILMKRVWNGYRTA